MELTNISGLNLLFQNFLYILIDNIVGKKSFSVIDNDSIRIRLMGTVINLIVRVGIGLHHSAD